MEIVKTKGKQDRFLYKDVKMGDSHDVDFLKISLQGKDELGRFQRLPKTEALKRVFYRECKKYGKRLIPFPKKEYSTTAFFPREFIGDVLLRKDSTIENIVLKFVLEDESVIPIDEWLDLAKERNDNFYEFVEANLGNPIIFDNDLLNELVEKCHLDYM